VSWTPDDVSAVLAEAVMVGDTPQQVELGAAVAAAVEARPPRPPATPDPEFLAALKALGQTLEPTTELADFDQRVVRPGDTLLVGARHEISAEQAERIKEQLGRELPGVKVLVLGALTVEGIYRNEGTA
jgi:hypothetical protein